MSRLCKYRQRAANELARYGPPYEAKCLLASRSSKLTANRDRSSPSADYFTLQSDGMCCFRINFRSPSDYCFTS